MQGPTRGKKSLLCDPGPELRLGGREEGRVKTTYGNEKKYLHPIRFEVLSNELQNQ